MGKRVFWQKVMGLVLLCALVLALAAPLAGEARAATRTRALTLYLNSATTSSTKLSVAGLDPAMATWKLSKKTVATVSRQGVVTARNKGTTTITAKQGKDSFVFKVTVKDVALSKKAVTINAGKTLALKLHGDAIKSARSSNAKVATISKGGVVTGKAGGTATMTVTSKRNMRFTCKVTVRVPVSKVSLAKTALTLTVGERGVSNAATVKPAGATNKRVAYRSSNTKVAKVSATGVVTPVAKGTATITATAQDGSKKQASCKVTVKARVVPTGLAFAKNSLTIDVADGPVKNVATVMPKGATNRRVTYASNKTSVATVSADGTITPKAAGTATITAKTAEGGKTASCSITVTNKNPVATNTLELRALLRSKDSYDSITLDTKDVLKGYEIMGTDRPSTVLVIKAPNGSFLNYTTFKEVRLLAVGKAGYVEEGSNEIDVLAEEAAIEVSEYNDADVSIRLRPSVKHAAITNLGNMGRLDVNTPGVVMVDNGGIVRKLLVRDDADLTLNGTNRQSVLQAELEAAPVIRTRLALDALVGAKASKAASIVLDEGSQGTEATSQNPDTLPSVFGLGTVIASVTDAQGAIVDKNTIVATYDQDLARSDSIKAIPVVSGYARDAANDGQGVPGATARLYPWTSEAASGALEGQEPLASATSDDQGKFEFAGIKASNYVLAVAAEGYAPAIASLVLANADDVQAGNDVRLVPLAAGEDSGSLGGVVVDAAQDDAVGLAGVTLRLRAGANNQTGPVLQTTTTGEDGSYQFASRLAAGVYTVEAVDLRGGTPAYLSASSPVVVASSQDISVNLAMVPGVDRNSLRFVLELPRETQEVGTVISPHLYGPRADGELFQVYQDDKSHVEDDKVVAWLSDSGAHNTTITVSKQASGTYTYLVHDVEHGGQKESEALGLSGAVVKVYSGATLVQTFDVPKQEGTVWAVCSYDSVTKQFTALNHMDYDDADPTLVGIDTVFGGLRATGVRTNELVASHAIVGNQISLDVTAPLTSENIGLIDVQVVDGATASVCKGDDANAYEVKLTGANGAVRTYKLVYTVDYGDLLVQSFVTNDMLTDYNIDEDEVTLTVKDRSLAAYRDFVDPVIAIDGATWRIDQDAAGNPLLVISVGQRTRTYAITTLQDWGDLTIEGFELNDVVTEYSMGDKYLRIVDPDRPLARYKERIVPHITQAGASYDVTEGEGGQLLVVLRYGALERKMSFDVLPDLYGGLRVAGVTANDVVTGKTNVDNEQERINLYVTTDDFDTWKDAFEPDVRPAGATYELRDEGDGYYHLTITSADGATRRYYEVHAYRDWKGLELENVPTGDVILQATVEVDTVSIHVADTSLGYWKDALEAAVTQEGFSCQVSEDEGAYRLVLYGDGVEHAYAIEVYRDWQGVEIDGVEINDTITNYECIDTQSGISWLGLTVTKPDFDDWKAEFRPQIQAKDPQVELGDNEDGSYGLTICANGITHHYVIEVTMDWRGLVLNDVVTNDVVLTSSTGEEAVYITVSTDDFAVWSKAFEPEVHERDDYDWRIVEQDDAYELLLTADGVTRRYDLFVTYDPSA